ncbi:hypothetical protein [Microbacterium phage MO526]|uniref:Holin n=1 Tax=Microbacterium phage MO526 TaxID=3108092 RepID=A0ABZ0ZX61_9CAUD|nr:hypothetical protein [Microbacterium phage MO526]
MYSGLPAGAKRVVQATLAGAWALSGLAGVSAVVASPVTIISELGLIGTIASGALLVLATGVAVVGVLASRYRLEWVASWGAAASLVPYLVTVWALTFTDTWTRSTQAFLVTSLVAFYFTRSALCAAHAAKLREAHALGTTAGTLVIEIGDGDDDRGTHTGG